MTILKLYSKIFFPKFK